MSDRAEELLESLWVRIVEKKQEAPQLDMFLDEETKQELLKSGYIRIFGNKIFLTDDGKKEGSLMIRRQRLAERLFADVLDIKKKLVQPISCQLEHLLHEGIEDNICILLGHPKNCPHGNAIPPGECCQKVNEKTSKVVSNLTHVGLNQRGKVAYLQTKDHIQLKKLMAMGVLPGASISLIQKYPSYVFQIGQSQFAIDRELAENIFVRIMPR